MIHFVLSHSRFVQNRQVVAGCLRFVPLQTRSRTKYNADLNGGNPAVNPGFKQALPPAAGFQEKIPALPFETRGIESD